MRNGTTFTTMEQVMGLPKGSVFTDDTGCRFEVSSTGTLRALGVLLTYPADYHEVELPVTLANPPVGEVLTTLMQVRALPLGTKFLDNRGNLLEVCASGAVVNHSTGDYGFVNDHEIELPVVLTHPNVDVMPCGARGTDSPGDEEVRVTSSTGGQKGRKPARYGLIPTGPLDELARLYGRGAAKYDDHNYRKGFDWSLSFDAMMRHAWAFWGGEDVDPETGSPHLANAVFHCFALMTFMTEHPDFDDRYKS